MLSESDNSWKLILDSKVSGQTAATFDAAVKGKSRILIVIQSMDNYVFGAFVADTFGTPGGWISGSRETFLFTLRNNNEPVKLIYSGQGNSGHFESCGLHLGDLTAFCDHSCGNPTSYILAPGYQATLNSSLLAGSSSYTPARMEVFEVLS